MLYLNMAIVVIDVVLGGVFALLIVGGILKTVFSQCLIYFSAVLRLPYLDFGSRVGSSDI